MSAGAAAVFVFALAMNYFLAETEKRHVLEREERGARMLAGAMRLPFTQILLYEEAGLMEEGGLLDLYVSRMKSNPDTRVSYAMVFDSDGTVVSHTDLTLFHTRPQDPLTLAALASEDIILKHVGDPFSGGVIDVAVPLNVSSKRFGTLRLGYSLGGLAETVRMVKRRALVLTASVSVVLLLLVFVVGRVMTRPILRLAGALDSVRLGSLEVIPLPARKDEIGSLQESYRIMVERLGREKEERERTRELLASAEKMATLGTLSAGIAHEVNNPLTGALHAMKALRKDSLPPQKRDRYLQVVEDSLARIRRSVSQLLDYSTVHSVNFSECGISRLVDQALELLSFQIVRSGIEVENRLPPLAVWGDARGLEQVLVNLVLNAVAAMPDGGRLTFSHVAEDGLLTLVVTDTGTGIPQENLDRIFEPFFTTKGIGEGTGLGLAVCRKIVEQHGGRIRVSSRPGQGASFFVSLPVSPPPAGAACG